MKKSELKALIKEVMDEAVWGTTTAKVFSGMKGKTIVDVVEHPDGEVSVSLNDGSKIRFEGYKGYSQPSPR